MNPVSVSYDGEISIIKISNPPVNAISLEVSFMLSRYSLILRSA